MMDITRVFQAFVAPAIFVSATALLILSINVRLMGIVSRLRQFVHAKYDAAKSGREQQASAYDAQIQSIEHRAEMIRRCFLMALSSLAGSIAACLLLGLSLSWPDLGLVAVAVFVVALLCLLAATYYYIREVMVALTSVQQESRDERFMDLPTSSDARNVDAV